MSEDDLIEEIRRLQSYGTEWELFVIEERVIMAVRELYAEIERLKKELAERA